MPNPKRREVKRGTCPFRLDEQVKVIKTSVNYLQDSVGVVARLSNNWVWLKFPNHPLAADTPSNWVYRTMEFGPFSYDSLAKMPQRRR